MTQSICLVNNVPLRSCLTQIFQWLRSRASTIAIRRRRSLSWCFTTCTRITSTSSSGSCVPTTTSSSNPINSRSSCGASTLRKRNSSVNVKERFLENVCWVFFFAISGQAGRGNNEEFGLLSLEFDENFCMGGPGILLSRETLKKGECSREFFGSFLKFALISSGSTYPDLFEKSLQHSRRRGSGSLRSEVCRNSMHVELRGSQMPSSKVRLTTTSISDAINLPSQLKRKQGFLR